MCSYCTAHQEVLEAVDAVLAKVTPLPRYPASLDSMRAMAARIDELEAAVLAHRQAHWGHGNVADRRLWNVLDHD